MLHLKYGCQPSLSITSCSLLGMDSTILRVHSSGISLFHSSRFWALKFLSFCFIHAHTFSIGLKPGLLPGHLMSWMVGQSVNHFVTIFYVWQGAPSCRKCVVWCRCMKNSSLCSNTCRYMVPFIISP